MAISSILKKKIEERKKEFDTLRPGKEELLRIIAEAEIAEGVYNSNAIENSTLTLKETEKILLAMEVERNLDLREVFEAKNLARVEAYVRTKASAEEISEDTILTLHAMLLTNIADNIAGRFRQAGEYVRVGTHIAPAPEHIPILLIDILAQLHSDFTTYVTDSIARFHLRFEHTHPFNDGNGRVGRLLINYQLQRLGFPPVIIRFKDRQQYYSAFREYDTQEKTKTMEQMLGLAVSESLSKRNAYLRGDRIVRLTEYAREIGESPSALLNKAKRQTIEAFREKGIWKIGMK